MTDKELLELAAKAAGLELPIGSPNYFDGTENIVMWNPLTDDGDALRLAVELHFIFCADNRDRVGFYYGEELASHGDVNIATRRAITRAAAEIGKDME